MQVPRSVARSSKDSTNESINIFFLFGFLNPSGNPGGHPTEGRGQELHPATLALPSLVQGRWRGASPRRQCQGGRREAWQGLWCPLAQPLPAPALAAAGAPPPPHLLLPQGGTKPPARLPACLPVAATRPGLPLALPGCQQHSRDESCRLKPSLLHVRSLRKPQSPPPSQPLTGSATAAPDPPAQAQKEASDSPPRSRAPPGPMAATGPNPDLSAGEALASEGGRRAGWLCQPSGAVPPLTPLAALPATSSCE